LSKLNLTCPEKLWAGISFRKKIFEALLDFDKALSSSGERFFAEICQKCIRRVPRNIRVASFFLKKMNFSNLFRIFNVELSDFDWKTFGSNVRTAFFVSRGAFSIKWLFLEVFKFFKSFADIDEEFLLFWQKMPELSKLHSYVSTRTCFFEASTK